MKHVRQFAIILVISFLGEILKAVLPLPIPASIYGLVLMLAALMLKIIPLEAVKDAGKFLHRDHAAHVYSGGCRTYAVMGKNKTDSCSSHYCDGHIYRACHGGVRPRDARQ